MRCNCNPSRAEFGPWRGVRRCGICGKVFHAGWKCRPQCEPPAGEDRPEKCPDTARPCRPEAPPAAEHDCCAPHAREDFMAGRETFDEGYMVGREGFDEGSTTTDMDGWQPEDEFFAQEETEREMPFALGEWTQVFPPKGSGETPGESGWPLRDLTDELPPAPH